MSNVECRMSNGRTAYSLFALFRDVGEVAAVEHEGELLLGAIDARLDRLGVDAEEIARFLVRKALERGHKQRLAQSLRQFLDRGLEARKRLIRGGRAVGRRRARIRLGP